MKKIVKYMPLIAIPLVLSSCAFIKNLIPGGKSNTTSGDTSQGSGSNSGVTPSGSWSAEIQAEMRQYLGEVLPFAQLDESTLYHGYDESYVDIIGAPIYAIGDDSSSDTGALNGYGDLLVASGYTKNTDDYGDYYTKTTSAGDLEVSYDWYEAGDDYSAGYEISVYIYSEGGSGEGGEGGEGGGSSDTSLSEAAAEIGEAIGAELEWDSDYSCYGAAFDMGDEGQTYSDTKAAESVLKPVAEELASAMPSGYTQTSAHYYTSSEDYWEDESGDTVYQIVFEKSEIEVEIISYCYNDALVGAIYVYSTGEGGGDSGQGGGEDIEGLVAHTATMNVGTNASEAEVNSKTAVKVGTGKAGGDMSISIGAGATKLVFYAGSWKGSESVVLTLSGVTTNVNSITLTADDGLSFNTPFTLSGSEATYKFTLDLTGVTSNATLTLTGGSRFVVWGATYYTPAE